MPTGTILMGVVGRPHGVRGLVHIHSYTADPAALAAYGPLSDEQGRTWTVNWKGADGVAELRDSAGTPLTDRTAAQRLTNLRLYIERDRLPPADDDEFYLADLVGLVALARDGRLIGVVTVVHDYGAGASLEISRAPAASPPAASIPAASLIVPFTRAAVPDVDIAAGTLTVDPPEEITGEAQAA